MANRDMPTEATEAAWGERELRRHMYWPERAPIPAQPRQLRVGSAHVSEPSPWRPPAAACRQP